MTRAAVPSSRVTPPEAGRLRADGRTGDFSGTMNDTPRSQLVSARRGRVDRSGDETVCISADADRRTLVPGEVAPCTSSVAAIGGCGVVSTSAASLEGLAFREAVASSSPWLVTSSTSRS